MGQPEKTKRHKILKWEKFINPLTADAREVEWPDDDDDTDMIDQKKMARNSIAMISSPMGLIPLTEYSSPERVFNFWIAHTNFNVSAKVRDMVEKVPGVEILDIFSRYRFRIGVGKLWEAGTVMSHITKKLGCKMIMEEKDLDEAA